MIFSTVGSGNLTPPSRLGYPAPSVAGGLVERKLSDMQLVSGDFSRNSLVHNNKLKDGIES